MTISKAAYAISNARLTGMRAELVSLMLQRGKLDEEGQSEATALGGQVSQPSGYRLGFADTLQAAFQNGENDALLLCAHSAVR